MAAPAAPVQQNFGNPVSYSDLKREQTFKKIPFEAIQRALLAASLVCCILSVIPGAGFYGSLALRSVAVLAVGVGCLAAWKNEGLKGLILQIVRTAFVALGLVGVALHQPLMVVAALGGDAIFQGVDILKGLQNKDLAKALSHATIMIVNALAIAGFITGWWQFMVAAAAVNAAMMVAFTVKASIRAYQKNDLTLVFEAICYGALSAVSIAASVVSAELYRTEAVKSNFIIKNPRYEDMLVYDLKGHLLGRILPGETGSFSVNHNEVCHGSLCGYLKYTYVSDTGFGYARADGSETVNILFNKPLSFDKFDTQPVGGASIATADHSVLDLPANQTTLLPAAQAVLDTFLQAPQQPVITCFLLDGAAETFTLRLKNSEKQSVLNFQAVCQNSAYIKGVFSSQMAESKKGRELTLDVDEPIFDQLVSFFHHGNLEEMDQLEEDHLLYLYELSDYYAIDRLKDLCLQEVAKRVSQAQWEDTELLKPYRNSGKQLDKLVALYDFN